MPYRACYYTGEDGQGEVVLTGPEHAALSDEALRAEALAEAARGCCGLIGDVTGLSRDDVASRLTVGEWRD